MKIGILTFHRAINYGAVLQCYALYRTLSDMGHEVDVIDYRPPYIERWRKPYLRFDNISVFLKSFVINIRTFFNRRKVNLKFDVFLQNMTFSPIIKSYHDFDNLSYDYYICGSDQIWNRRITQGGDIVFWGGFSTNGGKVISYAASVGYQPLDKPLLNDITRFSSNFSRLSVREDDLCSFLHKHGISAQVTVDPTLVVNKSVFDHIIETPQFSNYILVYALKNEAAAVGFALKIAKQKNAKVVVVRAMSSRQKYNCRNVEVIESVSPGAFVGFIRASLCNVIISFHGVVFSVLYKKNFYALQHETQGRYAHLLNNLGLKDRLVPVTLDVSFEPIDYNGVESRLEKFKCSSINYLTNSLREE